MVISGKYHTFVSSFICLFDNIGVKWSWMLSNVPCVMISPKQLFDF
jgi:hypothetical protein